jgi:hypothetical protein
MNWAIPNTPASPLEEGGARKVAPLSLEPESLTQPFVTIFAFVFELLADIILIEGSHTGFP